MLDFLKNFFYSSQIKLDVNFQYFLKKEDLPILHRNYDLYYETVIRTSAIDALKVCKLSVLQQHRNFGKVTFKTKKQWPAY